MARAVKDAQNRSEVRASAFHPLRTLGRAWFSSREIHPGDFEVAPMLELIPSQTWPLDDEGTEA